MPLNIVSTPNNPVIIGVASGKGGVGKSTVAVNLALAFSRLNLKAGLLDADVYGPSLRKMIAGGGAPRQSGTRIIPAMCQGIPVISMAYFRGENEAAAVRAPIANGIITQFLTDVDWQGIDILIIDFPPGTGDVQLTLAQKGNLRGVLIVTTPQEVALQDVRRSIHMFEQVKVPLLGVVENMSFFTHPKTKENISLFGTGGGRRVANEYALAFLGEIPLDPEICRLADLGQSLFSHSHTSPAALAFIQIATSLREKINEKSEKNYRSFSQKDAATLQIEWNDGTTHLVPFARLQQHCACAGCMENKKPVSADVTVSHITPMGSYGLKFSFSSGCSNGIYSLELIKELMRAHT